VSGEITNMGGSLAAAMAETDRITEEYAQHMRRIAAQIEDGTPSSAAVKDYAQQRAQQASALVGSGAELLALSHQADAVGHAAREKYIGLPNASKWVEEPD
jgi:hypothetical protein